MPLTKLTEKFTKAFDYARVLHASDVRKGTKIPYLAHLIAVASIVIENGGTEDQAIAALLHDAGEDHGGHARIDDIRAQFGNTVANIVEACSDDLPADGAPKRPWRVRKDEYIERLKHEPLEIVLVSAADKLHNARAILSDYREIGEKLWPRFNAGRDATLWYYNELCNVIEGRLKISAPQLAKELRATVDALNKAAGH
jgi:(p)ppGpp synthase/HD superfamily hydrolase